MTSPEVKVPYLCIVPAAEGIDPFEDPLFKRWDITGISAALAADSSFSGDTFDWKFTLNTPRQHRLQDAPPFLKISPNPLYPDGLFPDAYFDSGIGGFTVYVSNILNIEPEGSAVRIISRDELGETTLQLDRHGAMHVSTVPYSKTTRIRE